MEVRDGYNKTEIGIIPKEWKAEFVDNISDVKSGKRLPLGSYLIETKTNYPYIRVADMFHGGVSLENIKYVAPNVFPAIKNYRIFKEDIFISVAGTLGVVGVIPNELDGANLTENADRLTNIKCDRNFLLYVFMSDLIQKRIEEERTLGAQPKLALTRIRKFLIPIPPTKEEQKAIAEVLSDTDKLIQALEKRLAKKRMIKQGAMQKLLTPKDGWKVKKLEEIISFVVDNRGKTPPIVNNGHPLIEVNAIYKQGKSPNYKFVSKFVDDKTYKNWFRDGHPQPGDILVVTVGTAGTTSYITKSIGCIAQNIIALRVYKQFSSEYFYYLTTTKQFKDKVRAVLMGAVQPSLKVPHINNFEFRFPSIEEQTRIATILSDMDKEIETLEKKLAKYKQLKQGLMQNLLTGKIRLL